MLGNSVNLKIEKTRQIKIEIIEGRVGSKRVEVANPAELYQSSDNF